MCGIAGYFNSDPRRPVNETVLHAMAASLEHRGPDDEGVWLDERQGIGLCHRRLSILDLSPLGHQPMISLSGRYVIVFNGEIYNYRTLQAELKADGIVFRGGSDTEVLLAAMEKWGVQEAVKRCVGMFAIAVWDNEEKMLSLVRDRLGEKPLYYGWYDNMFVFGSELKPFHHVPGFSPTVDRQSLSLLVRYCYIPAPYSIYTDIYKLPPGAMFQIRSSQKPSGFTPFAEQNGCGQSQHYYWNAQQVTADRSRGPAMEPVDAVERLNVLLKETIKAQMIADVPVGAFLSGGVDSSTVVALMQAVAAGQVNTFTIGFHERDYNEAEYAKDIAAYLGTRHTELYVTAKDVQDVIPRLPLLYDEPFADSSQLPTFLVAAMTRKHVTVSLSGDGGDELFGGYNRYFWGRNLWSRLSRLPRNLRAVLARAMTLPSPQFLDSMGSLLGPLAPAELRAGRAGDKLHKLAGVIDVATPQEMYFRLVSICRQPDRLVLNGSEPPTLLTEQRFWPEIEDFSEWMMALDLVTYLPDDILVKNDRAAMGVSLETRMPFLDHRIVEFAWSLPFSLKVQGNQGKWILRQVLDKYIPSRLLDRPKMGFGIPIHEWLRGPLREWAENLLDRKKLAEEGFFNVEEVRAKWQEHLSGKRNWQYLLWNILMFQAWQEEYNHR